MVPPHHMFTDMDAVMSATIKSVMLDILPPPAAQSAGIHQGQLFGGRRQCLWW